MCPANESKGHREYRVASLQLICRWLASLLIVALLVLLLSGCGGGDDDGGAVGPTSSPEATAAGQVVATATHASGQPEATADEATPTPGPEAEAALAIVEGFDPANTDAIHQLNTLAFPDGQPNPADIVPALAPLLESDDLNQRWAALYVVALLSDTPEEIAVLQGALDDPELTYRVMAAGSLAGLGVVEALPVLIEGLEAEWDVPYSDPPRALSAHARTALEHYTGESFEDVAGWQGWWEQVEESIQWDGERYVAG